MGAQCLTYGNYKSRVHINSHYTSETATARRFVQRLFAVGQSLTDRSSCLKLEKAQRIRPPEEAFSPRGVRVSQTHS